MKPMILVIGWFWGLFIFVGNLKLLIMEEINEGTKAYILQTAKDYDMSYEDVKYYYIYYSREFFQKLEDHIKNRS